MANYLEVARGVMAALTAPEQPSGPAKAGASDLAGAYEQQTGMASSSELVAESKEADPTAPRLKGHAVELWRDGSRFFVVADEEDAQEAVRRFGAHRGEVWTPGEIELVARIGDRHLRDEVTAFKRSMNGCLSRWSRAVSAETKQHP